MKTKALLFILTSISIHTADVSAACTIESAQKNMMEVTNMMQVYNKQQLDYLENQGGLPPTFERKFSAFVDKSNALGVKFAEIMENQTNLRPEDPIDDSVCQGYQALFQEYVPNGYQKKEVKLQQTSTTNADCDTNSLWARYAEFLEEQNAMVANGTFTEAETFDLQRLNVEIGEASTTDIDKACALMDELETTIKAKR